MKKYLIKYYTYDGTVKTKEKTGYDEQHVINQLYNCKEVYWVKPIKDKSVFQRNK